MQPCDKATTLTDSQYKVGVCEWMLQLRLLAPFGACRFKVKERFEFPLSLDMFKYTADGLAAMETAQHRWVHLLVGPGVQAVEGDSKQCILLERPRFGKRFGSKDKRVFFWLAVSPETAEAIHASVGTRLSKLQRWRPARCRWVLPMMLGALSRATLDTDCISSV